MSGRRKVDTGLSLKATGRAFPVSGVLNALLQIGVNGSPDRAYLVTVQENQALDQFGGSLQASSLRFPFEMVQVEQQSVLDQSHGRLVR